MGNCLGRGEEPKTVTIIIQQGDFNYNDNSNNEKKVIPLQLYWQASKRKRSRLLHPT